METTMLHSEVQTVETSANDRLPGPRGIPFLGKLGSNIRFFGDPIKCLRHLHANYAPVATVSRGNSAIVCVFGPELNRTVLSDPNRFQNNAELPVRVPKGSSLQRLTGFLVGMNGDGHRRLRRAMVPMFSQKYLDHHRDNIVAAAEAGLAEWKPGRDMDLSTATADVALRVAFRCLFGLDLDESNRPLARMVTTFISGATSLKMVAAPLPIPGFPYWRFLRQCEQLEQRLRLLIEERREDAAGRNDLLSILMTADDAGEKLAEDVLVGLANELFIAGHETTARTLAWTLFLLERHPRILEQLLAELSVLDGQPPTVAQLGSLPLLDAVVKESMRLLSATPFLFFRSNRESVELGGYRLPPGGAVVVSPLITHHLPEIFPEPNQFRPERWSRIKPGPYEYLPFGAGPRTCLGAPFANVSLRVMLAMIVQHLRLRVAAGSDVSYQGRGIILATKKGIPVRVEAQDGKPILPAPITGNLRDFVDLPTA
jgi:cytochrome P450